jgi:hypothetical protein
LHESSDHCAHFRVIAILGNDDAWRRLRSGGGEVLRHCGQCARQVLRSVCADDQQSGVWPKRRHCRAAALAAAAAVEVGAIVINRPRSSRRRHASNLIRLIKLLMGSQQRTRSTPVHS